MSPFLTALPAAALERHLAILGTSDAGKTYAAKGEVEALLDGGRRVCVIDPTGVWWGLRLQGDGATPSRFALPIFGGVGPKGRTPAHTDAPIAADSGERLAELIAEGDFSAIIDVSSMSVSDRTALFADFAETLAQVNTRPLHLVIDEAHLFAPQGRVFDPQSARMLHAANHLVAGGRARGVRVMLLSQRPAKLHKDSLTQVQTLVAMLNVSPQDRTAVKDWITDAADAKKGAEILASLPGLQVGEGWVWAPRLDVLERIKFRPITTFDSSRTPDDHGAATSPAKLAPLDLDAIRAALGAPAADTPAVSAEAEDASTSGSIFEQLMEVSQAADKVGYARGLQDGKAQGDAAVFKARAAALAWVSDRIVAMMQEAQTEALTLSLQAAPRADEAAPSGSNPHEGRTTAPAPPRAVIAPAPSAPPVGARPPAAHPSSDGDKPGLPLGCQDILAAALTAPRPVTIAEAAVLAGKLPVGGYFERLRRAIRDAGWSEPLHNVMADDEDATCPTLADLVEDLAPKFAAGAKGLKAAGDGFRVIARAGALNKQELAARMGIASHGGYYERLWRRLRNSPLTVEQEDGAVDLIPILRDLPRGDL